MNMNKESLKNSEPSCSKEKPVCQEEPFGWAVQKFLVKGRLLCSIVVSFVFRRLMTALMPYGSFLMAVALASLLVLGLLMGSLQ